MRKQVSEILCTEENGSGTHVRVCVTGHEADRGRQQPGKVDQSSGPMFPLGRPSPGLSQSGGSQKLDLAQKSKPRSSQSVSSVIKLIFRLKHMSSGMCQRLQMLSWTALKGVGKDLELV